MSLLFITIGELAEIWNRALFSEQPTLTICVFRVLTGFLVLTETRNWLSVYKPLLSVDGWFGYPEYASALKPFRFSLLNYLPATNKSVELVLLLQFIAGLCLMVGVFPQLAALLCFVTLVSIHNRNIYVLSSGDALYRFFCLLLIFAPSDTQLSLLNLPHLLNADVLAYSWTLLMIRLFMANIYMKNVLFKLLGDSWLNGTATQQVLNVRIWNRGRLPAALNHAWFYKATTYGTLVIEIALFTLVWIDEFRLPVLALGVLLHLSLWLFLRIGFFQMAMICGLGAFVTPQEYAVFFGLISRL
ncbi:HTTM domain-containing protein [Spirosoma taeanense]|uniref:HTTM domain-containing protein n=1 Tax=Spirosoma taeanense TaxID=2735870 RepID=A0A6M5Y6T9_9BACT|nr:HTTM domain-containing protein [Spirosoma taeanense]QJW90118.1 HTTM domain-containing protein [Spirosoma taeanense]